MYSLEEVKALEQEVPTSIDAEFSKFEGMERAEPGRSANAKEYQDDATYNK